jgi:cytidine deaminase
MPERVYLHAEVAALLKAGKQHVDRMEIKRINADGTYGMAAPCAICREALKAFNVRKVSHT